MRIQVPATTANLGPGFDSIGLALGLYLTVSVEAPSDTWNVSHNLGADIPTDETNLVIETALKLAPEISPHQITMKSDIPPARGLGSSSAAIVAGIELANQLGNLALTDKQKVAYAAEFEGHPDNAAPAILGDLVICSKQSDADFYVQQPFPDADFLVFIPETPLLTSESRAVLPREMAFSDAVRASSVASVMVAAVLSGDLVLAGKMMERDEFHETYRAKLVPHLAEIRKISAETGGYASVLSGAGPTVLVLAPRGKSAHLKEKLEQFDPAAEVLLLQTESNGVRVFN
ncbi:homoserine kinase [Listeria floridensis FSL S10-1187]|uniref:Homoserine kinase n=1 Tax=Listeria floridensis FSL S10-1187 TaxID=1265817 RepID=A0ABN0RG51_9LIST|nr:homoserine kinase [Listeria floridensis]EUJ32722.1 homoserine kinase [Listeria floridensis FSL S10-1187]